MLKTEIPDPALEAQVQELENVKEEFEEEKVSKDYNAPEIISEEDIENEPMDDLEPNIESNEQPDTNNSTKSS